MSVRICTLSGCTLTRIDVSRNCMACITFGGQTKASYSVACLDTPRQPKTERYVRPVLLCYDLIARPLSRCETAAWLWVGISMGRDGGGRSHTAKFPMVNGQSLEGKRK